MQIITLILSILAFVFAGAALILTVMERKHSRALMSAVDQRFKGMAEAYKKSREALLQYVDEADKMATVAVEKLGKDVNGRVDKTIQALQKVNGKVEEVKGAVKKNAARIEDLEQGVVPDFETAQKAVSAVNDINKGIAGILGFDPLEAMKQSRQEGD